MTSMRDSESSLMYLATLTSETSKMANTTDLEYKVSALSKKSILATGLRIKRMALE